MKLNTWNLIDLLTEYVCVIKGVADEFTDTRLIFVAWKLFRHS